MSSWYPSVPTHWHRARVKSVAERVTDGAHISPDTDNGQYDFVSTRDVKGGKIDFAGALKTSQETYQYMVQTGCQPNRGDVLFSKDGTVGETAIVTEARDFVVASSLVIITPRVGVMTPSYLAYMFRSKPAQEQAASFMRGAGLPRLSVGNLARLEVLVPPLDEQRAITNYLARETGRIDTLIEEQQRLIEMLRERRDSIWASCVEAARKIGRPVTIRRVIKSIVDGPFGSSLTSAHYSDDGARVIRLGNIGVNEFKEGDAAFIPLDYAEELKAHAVEQGDVVVAGLGDDKMPLGRAAVVPALGPAIVKADCYRLRPNEQVSAAYLAWVMSAPQTRSQIMLLARGSTRARLNTKVVQQVEIPLPDRATQDALVTRSDSETAKIDRLIAESERFVDLARERRAALITAAVTGQIDIRETA